MGIKLKLTQYFLLVTIVGFSLAVIQRFYFTMLTISGLVGGVLGVMIGTVVGRVVAHEPTTRIAMVAVTSFYGIGLVSGQIHHSGEELFLFLLVSVCLGLCCGCLTGPMRDPSAIQE